MRARFFLLGGGVTLIAAGFVMQACGSTEETPLPAADAGMDVVDSAPRDSAPPEQDAATCDLSANFTDGIPDASIADGASTSGLCVQCANGKCTDEVAACNHACSCQQIAGSALECYVKNPNNVQVCAAPFLGVDQQTQSIGIALITCLQSACKKECATDSFQQQDGGKKDGGDGGDAGQ